MTKPNCLHIPRLYRGKTAILYWAPVLAAAGYELDCVFDEDFESALTGLSWQVLDEQGKPWEELDAGGTWQEMESLHAAGVPWYAADAQRRTWDEWEAENRTWLDQMEQPSFFTVYRGEGTKTPTPQQGYTWDNMDSAENSWEQFEQKQFSWQDLLFLLSLGLAWGQLDELDLTWDEIEKTGPDHSGYTWQKWGQLAASGLFWESIDAHFCSWEEGESEELSWGAFEMLPGDCETHRGCTIPIPAEHYAAFFRVRAYGPGGEESAHLTSGGEAIVHSLKMELQARKGEVQKLLLAGQCIQNGLGVTAEIGYDIEREQLQKPDILAPCVACLPEYRIKREYGVPGRMKVWYTPSLPQRKKWTGPVAQFPFKAQANGKTDIWMDVSYTVNTK